MLCRDLFVIARILGRERLRQLRLRYGWAACGTLSFVLLPAAWLVSSTLSRMIAQMPEREVAAGLSRIWAAWVAAGVVAGRDLGWHPHIERLIRLPLPFYRLYGMGLLLSLLTFPLFLLLCAVEVIGWNAAPSARACLLLPLGFTLLTLSVRLSVSIVRSVLQRRSPLERRTRTMARVVGVFISAAAVLSFWGAPYVSLSPGYQLAQLMLDREAWQAILIMFVQTGALLLADYVLQFELTYSGITGPQTSPASRAPFDQRLSLHCSPATVLWRMSLRGWVRNRNALLLFMWGTGYGFVYTLWTRPQSRDYFFMFCCMVLFFHSYLRGNVLGTDHRAAWMYLMFPIPISSVFRAKYRALTALQLVMAGAVLLPASLHHPAGMAMCSDWAAVLSYVASTLLLTEILGSILSISHPEAIERTFSYAGGMTLGAVVVGAGHTLLLAPYVFWIARSGPAASQACNRTATAVIPALLWVLRARATPCWIRRAVQRDSEKFLYRLGT